MDRISPPPDSSASRRARSSRRSIAELPAFPTPRGSALQDDLGIFDAKGLAASVADDRAQLEQIIEQARATDTAVRRIKSVSLRSGQRETMVRSSTGTETAYSRSSFSLVAGVVAERDGQSELGWESDVATSRGALPWGAIGAAAAAKAVSRLGAGRPAAGRQPVILDREVVAEFLSLLGSTLSADAVLKGRSPLAGKVGAAVAAGTVTVIDDPTLPGAAGSAPCDDEGQPTRRKVLIDAGVLTGYLHSLETAHRMGVDPTGNGFRGGFESLPLPRPGNLVLQPGRQRSRGVGPRDGHDRARRRHPRGAHHEPGLGRFLGRRVRIHLRGAVAAGPSAARRSPAISARSSPRSPRSATTCVSSGRWRRRRFSSPPSTSAPSRPLQGPICGVGLRPSSLRRTARTPHSSGLARLAPGPL